MSGALSIADFVTALLANVDQWLPAPSDRHEIQETTDAILAELVRRGSHCGIKCRLGRGGMLFKLTINALGIARGDWTPNNLGGSTIYAN